MPCGPAPTPAADANQRPAAAVGTYIQFHLNSPVCVHPCRVICTVDKLRAEVCSVEVLITLDPAGAANCATTGPTPIPVPITGGPPYGGWQHEFICQGCAGGAYKVTVLARDSNNNLLEVITAATNPCP
jgi:hypothetical protein